MRVVHVCTDPGVPVFGSKGSSVHVQAVLRVLARSGAQVHVVCVRTGGRPPTGLEDVVVHALPRVRGEGAAEREPSAQRADAAVTGVLDAIAADGPVDVVYERYALWGRSATRWAADRGVPSVLEVNAPLIAEQREHRELLDEQGAERVAREAIGAAAAVVCVSEPVARWARTRAEHPGRVAVVPNGVDTQRIQPLAPGAGQGRRGDAEDVFTIGFVGTLKPWHGVEVLLEAFAQLAARDDAVRLLLVGDGPQAPSLQAQAERAGVAHRVQLTGAVDPADVPALLDRMDVATAPYPQLADFYFSPLKVYEYLAAGVPVVASDVGDLADVLDGGRLGELVPPGDVAALTDVLARLQHDPDRRTALARDGRRAAVDRHDWTRVVDRSLQLAGASAPPAVPEQTRQVRGG